MDDLSQDISAAIDGGSGVTDAAATDTTPTEGAKQLPPLEAPSNWSQQDRDSFTALANEKRQHAEWLLNRHKAMESSYGKRMQQFTPIQRQWQQMQELLAPHRQSYSMSGMDDMQFMRSLLSAHRMLQENPAGAMQWLAQRYGIDLGALTQEQQQVDPQVRALQQQIAQLSARLEQGQASASDAQVQSLSDQVGQWSQATDETGQPRFPYFDDVADQMVDLINAAKMRGQHVGMSQLQDIYDQAVWANPHTRAKARLVEQQAAEKKAAAERQRKADEARRAGFDVRGQGGVNMTPNTGGSIRDDLMAAFGSGV